MVKTGISRPLLGIFLAGALVLAPASAPAATYKCVENSVITYKDAPCGDNGREMTGKVSVVTPVQSEPKEGGGVSALLERIGLSGKEAVVGLLLILIPLSLIFVFVLSRKSQSRT